ncbi:MAG: alpha/beta hydrolase [Desulfobacterales bacterium]|nr:alpha/beta hydrolase [Desulfobacterales bacterium]
MIIHNDYNLLDVPEVNDYIFHQRLDLKPVNLSNTIDFMIKIEDGIHINSKLHTKNINWPTILFFHGNGEIVSEYDGIRFIYFENKINFWVVDYRGYGHSEGKPLCSKMISDSNIIFEFAKNWLIQNKYKGPLLIMGRSLGSASALEIAYRYDNQLDGIIIESGFAYTLPLLKLMGAKINDLSEENGFKNIEKIKAIKKPVLIIHAENDNIIPLNDAQTLFNACQSSWKKLVIIPKTTHNNILTYGLNSYFKAIRDFSQMTKLKLLKD